MLQKPLQAKTETLLAKAEQPAVDALQLHAAYRGKIQMALRCPIKCFDDFAIWYTPGVAAPCKAIAAHPELVYEYTNKGNSVAIISDGTRVLGLGDIGPEAGLPVMEGKALLFKYLAGIDAYPLLLDTKDPQQIIEIVLALQPSFGAINLEDIAQPKCFSILNSLRDRARIPVWHDDQQGTATVVLAGLINALQLVGKPLSKARIVFIGCGAANITCSRLLFKAGATPELCIAVDRRGILHRNRQDIQAQQDRFAEKWKLCQTTNAEQRTGDITTALQGADVVIGFSAPQIIAAEWIAKMAKDAIIFACANPVPEIWPWEAKAAGAAIVATGRSDFPNQVNNALGFPGIFRGTLDVQAKTITDEMCFAAAYALAEMAKSTRIHPDHILPTIDEWEVVPHVAAAVAMKAIEQHIAVMPLTYEAEYQKASEIIQHSRLMAQRLMETGLL